MAHGLGLNETKVHIKIQRLETIKARSETLTKHTPSGVQGSGRPARMDMVAKTKLWEEIHVTSGVS